MKKNSLRSVLALVVLASFLVVPVMAAEFGRPYGKTFVISAQSTEELDPAIAYNSQAREYLVVFWNDRSGNDDIRAERISWNGKSLGGFWVATGAGHDRRYPDVVYNDRANQYLVVWEDYVQAAGAYSIQGRLISATGQFVSDEMIRGVSVNTTPAHPAVAYAYTADKYLVVWEEDLTVGVDTWIDIVGQVVNSDGSLSGSNFDISTDYGANPQRRPDVAYNRARNDYLVVWENWWGSDSDINAFLVSTNGTLSGIRIHIAVGGLVETEPRVAAMPQATADGAYLVVWEEHSASHVAAMAQLVGGKGALLGPPRTAWSFSSTAGPAIRCAVAASEKSEQWLIVLKADSSQAIAQAYSIDFMADSGWHFLDSGPGADHPAVASGPYGDFLIAVDRAPFGTRDIYGQLWANRNLAYLPVVAKNY